MRASYLRVFAVLALLGFIGMAIAQLVVAIQLSSIQGIDKSAVLTYWLTFIAFILAGPVGFILLWTVADNDDDIRGIKRRLSSMNMNIKKQENKIETIKSDAKKEVEDKNFEIGDTVILLQTHYFAHLNMRMFRDTRGKVQKIENGKIYVEFNNGYIVASDWVMYSEIKKASN